MNKELLSKAGRISLLLGVCAIPCLGQNGLMPDTYDYCGLLQLGQNLINFMLTMTPIIAVAVIVYGGFRIMTSGGSPEGLEAGYDMIKTAVIGLAIVFGAWLIVSTILHFLGANNASTWFTVSC